MGDKLPGLYAASADGVARERSGVGAVFWTYRWFLSLAVVLVLRLVVLTTNDVALYYDEAYYHYWSVSPAWGYYSKPPMVAWLIHLATMFDSFPVSEWVVRLPSLLCYTGATVFVFLLGRDLFDVASAKLAALLFYTMPLVGFNSVFITTDAPLLLCWSACLWLFWRALSIDAWPYWLATGLIAGLGLLSKYSMGVLAPSLLGFLILTDRSRLLLSMRLWVAIGLAFAVWLPNLFWNAGHGFISFQHTSEISQLDRGLFHPRAFLEFFAGQFVVFGPILFWGVLRFIGNYRTASGDEAVVFLSLTGFVMLGLICLQAVLARAHVNWAAPAYVSLSILAAYYLRDAHRYLVRLSLGFGVVFMLGFYFFTPIQAAMGVEAGAKNNPYHRLTGWRELVQKLPPDLYGSNTQWLSGSRKLLSYLHFYLPEQRDSLAQRLFSLRSDSAVKNHFDLVSPLVGAAENPDSANQSFLLLNDGDQPPYERCFEGSVLAATVRSTVFSSLPRKLEVYRVKGYLGNDVCSTILGR